MDRKLKISVVGTGKIVREVLPLVLREDMRYTVTSIYVHRSFDDAANLAATYGIPTIYTDYESLLENDDADFIYIANINTAHYGYALKALQHGRNIIVEKPLCTIYEDACRLMEEASRRHLYIFEAVSLLYNPVYEKIASSIVEIGEISMVTGNYSQLSSRYEMYCNHVVAPAFDPALAGGALMDLNVYNVNFMVGMWGIPVKEVYYPRIGYNGVDLSGAAILEYDGFLAVCCSAKDSDAPSGAVIQGDKGYIEVKSPVSVLTRAEVHLQGKPVKVFETPEDSHRLEFEFRRFREIYLENDYEAMLEKSRVSLGVMKVLDSLRK